MSAWSRCAAFPIAAPDNGISLLDAEGHELVWIEHLSELSQRCGRCWNRKLASREFMPEIRRIKEVSSFATPSTWQVETDEVTPASSLRAKKTSAVSATPPCLIADSHGIQFLISDLAALDRASRKLLDRFL